MQTAKFAVIKEIDHEPAFGWWVMHVLKKRNRIIASIRKYALDAKNGNTLWADAITKEMENVRVAFEVLPDGKSVPIGHQFVQCHTVFDIKMEEFR